MTPQQFVAKWSKIQQKETAVSQTHFNDVCQLINHLTPIEFDPEGKRFTFETQTSKPDGRKGFADVYFQGHFIWEYKGPHKDLDKAYQQLQLYRESLQNPPLLITSDIHAIIIHTNFNNYPIQKHTVGFDEIISGDGVKKLRWAFFSPDKFKPEKTQEQITKATADTFLQVAEAIKQHRQTVGESYTDGQIAHLMARLLFCLFAEDLHLLPNQIFTQMVQAQNEEYSDFLFGLRNLFREMRTGGTFGFYKIRHFDGTLFDDDFVPELPPDLGQKLMRAAQQDWSAVDPSIFGTLFERVIDEGKRAQLGAHYTSEADIMLIVEPVLMAPLRQKWDKVRRQASAQPPVGLSQDKTAEGEPPGGLLAGFAQEIAAVRVLDPACGSGNFLYVALRELLNLQKEVIVYAARKGLPPIELTVSPEQLYGIEINPYAHELAQITAWIGYLQWRHENGFGEIPDPVLSPLNNIQQMDAILAYDADGNPIEPEWPAADVIIGNPPFLGGQKILRELGEKYTLTIRGIYNGRIPNAADLVTYWFERARTQIDMGKANRAGLLATQSIRGEASRPVLNKIKNSGDIFMAWSDRPWILDGAAVRVSMIGFDSGNQKTKILDGHIVNHINADLTSGVDLTTALSLPENNDLGYMGIIRVGPFEISEAHARKMLNATNKASEAKNESVVKHWIRAKDLTDRPQNMWIIDFGVDMSLEEAEKYEMPIAHVRNNVKPKRDKTSNGKNRKDWWLFEGRRTGMRKALLSLERYIATPLVGKHRLFRWYNTKTIPDARVIVIARDDDCFFGILHSKAHELWSLNRVKLRHGIGNDPAYNVSICLASFPLPWPPGQEPSEAADARVAEIGRWARALVAWRQAWLNPPREEMYAGLGTAYDKMVKKRTLTNLYNGLVYYRQTRPQGSSRPLGLAWRPCGIRLNLTK
ncbi:FIG045374: Type II restriction enzyme, methylase subunit YeeA [hydrothermal vent metagenome]|uniref:site-specific DNA-methyltransferase (adenine-specific) n=1 Tax=hydrothermal vent metagenome TaxID=652676 RepID=A0A3B0UZQ0_9ZZZZ